MKNRMVGFWQAIEAVPGAAAVDSEWKLRFGSDYGPAKDFLRPNGKLASSHPCMVQRGCGCQHEVVVHDPEDIVAVCRCERGCETFALQRSDIVVHELDRRSLDAALAKVFGLIEEPDPTIDLYGTTRIGYFTPYAGYRFPVYLTIQIEPNDFSEVLDGLLSRNDTPFILLAPTRGLCTSKAEKRLMDRDSSFVSLSENVAVDAKRQFRLLQALEDILAQFRSNNLPSPKEGDSMVFFPTPQDASWRDVSIRFTDGHTVSIKVKSVGGVFNYTQMGMANNKNGNPTLQWKLLEVFAKERGILDWNSDEANPRNQKRRELLARNLREFFRIEGDPFKMTKDGKGWQARFLISPEE